MRLKAILEVINEVSYEHKPKDEMLVSINTLLTLKREIDNLRLQLDVKNKRLLECQLNRDGCLSKLIQKSIKYDRFDERI